MNYEIQISFPFVTGSEAKRNMFSFVFHYTSVDGMNPTMNQGIYPPIPNGTLICTNKVTTKILATTTNAVLVLASTTNNFFY